MFDVGFSEMIVIAIVALVVLGPEKLPKIARTVGKFYGGMQRYMSGFKADIEREVALDNMRKATADAQQKLLELQSQVKVLSGEIPELAAYAAPSSDQAISASQVNNISDVGNISAHAELKPEAIVAERAAAANAINPATAATPSSANSDKEDEVPWKKKA